MKLPAVLTLSFLLFLTFCFLWVITPRQKAPVDHITVSPATQNIPVKTVKTLPPLTSAQKIRVAQHAEKWSKEPVYEADFNALDPSYKMPSMTDSMFDPSDDYWGLPRDDKDAYELVDAYCTACHSASIVMQQRATPDRWKELLIWMEEKQGMAKIPDEDEDLVLEYIGTYFSTN